MEKKLLTGALALLILVQTPFIFSLTYSYCEEKIPSKYEVDCKYIIDLDLGHNKAKELIDNLEDSYIIADIPEYPSLFSDEQLVIEQTPVYYNPKVNLQKKYIFIYKLIIFFFLNYLIYQIFKKYFGGALWNVA